MFNSIAEGGVWGVPRSGLIFRKENGRLILQSRMPWAEGMLVDETQLRNYQDDDARLIKSHFEEAGIQVDISLR